MLNMIIPTVWDMVFLYITIIIVLTIRKNDWIRISPVAWDIVPVYAISGSTLILVIAIYGVIQPAVEWNLVDCMLLTISIISGSTLICLVTNWLDCHKGDLGVASVKLRRMKTALCSLDSLPYSKKWIRWLENEEDLQGNIRLVYDGCGYLKRFNLFSFRAGSMLNRANDLLVQADSFLHPKHELRGTMKFYKKMVINFIKNPKCELLGIWGMGGTGKTSLLKLLVGDFGSDYADDSFQVLLVRSGIQCTSVRQVQQAIATSMGLPLGRNETSQAQIIRDHLKDKSFLLLLDDLWEYLDLNDVGIPFPLGTVVNSFEEGLERRTWRKVVFTSRYMDLCNQMGCGHSNTIQMKSFDEDDAWELLDRGWSVFSRVDAVKPQPNAVSAVKDKQYERLSGGMKDNYKKVCSFIEAEGAQLVLMGIWGMRGVGKTTLLRLVHDFYTAAACFDHIMLVGAATGHMVRNVQHAIAINLGLDWGMMSSLDELSRGKHIFDHLEHKSFLLLLDDIREPLNWWAIGLPLFLHRRQKIILVTRSQAGCALMGCAEGNTMEMRHLRNDEAWKLFNDKVEVDDHPQLQHFAHKMVARCGGLPLALSALGRAMSSKRDPREWRCAYNQLTDMSLEPCEIDENVGVLILSPPWKKTSAHTADTSLQEIAPSHARSPVDTISLINVDMDAQQQSQRWSKRRISIIRLPGCVTATTQIGEGTLTVSLTNIDKDANQQVVDILRKDAIKSYTTDTSKMAVLTATVTFCVVLIIRGEYNSDCGSEGLPIKSLNFAFLTFLIADTLAVCSSSALAFVCITVMRGDYKFLIYYRSFTKKLMRFAYMTMLMAFLSGVYLVLSMHRICWRRR